MEPRAAVVRDDNPAAPTPERAAIANGSLVRDDLFDAKSASRVPIALRFRIATPIEKMFQDGRITDHEKRAAQLLHKDYTLGHIVPGLVAKYGSRMGSGGTPLAQQIDTDRLTPEELKTFHHNRFTKAFSAIGHHPTAYWTSVIACEVHIGEPAKIPSLEDVGRAYGGYECRKRAQAAGSVLIKSGLERLSDFYGFG